MTWFEENPGRLEAEQVAVHSRYPQAVFVKRDGLIRIELCIRGRYSDYLAELTYPRDFPWAMIEVRIVKPPLEPSPHRWSADKICICHQSDVRATTSGRNFCDWAVGWIRRYEQTLDGKPWREEPFADER